MSVYGVGQRTQKIGLGTFGVGPVQDNVTTFATV